ncbi:TetR/AcrR family transcriptional regulator [Enterococcus hulanensis]|uniref:TetR/AcrR family transcriptional regulator n=1 Tax=Enterococcus hulanensis TaxID=2559929 RepID=UPI001A90B39D|nr:TetR/AcrR family transcriptional regulator [Enterococcus hulanensis]MBO0455296.1 TetR/AcrR family transcriptional regulator [Enterococcus hulanensis]
MAATNHAQAIKQDSKDYLTTALLQLLEKNIYSSITVSQVVRRAGVSRMAFYRNFDSLDDVLFDYFSAIIKERFADILQHVPPTEKLKSLEIFFKDFAKILEMSVSQGYEPIIRQVFNENMYHFYDSLPLFDAIKEPEKRYYIKFMSDGVYSIWREWLINNQKESLDTIHQLLATLQYSTLEALKKQQAN